MKCYWGCRHLSLFIIQLQAVSLSYSLSVSPFLILIFVSFPVYFSISTFLTVSCSSSKPYCFSPHHLSFSLTLSPVSPVLRQIHVGENESKITGGEESQIKKKKICFSMLFLRNVHTEFHLELKSHIDSLPHEDAGCFRRARKVFPYLSI